LEAFLLVDLIHDDTNSFSAYLLLKGRTVGITLTQKTPPDKHHNLISVSE